MVIKMEKRLIIRLALMLGATILAGCVSPKPPVANRQMELRPSIESRGPVERQGRPRLEPAAGEIAVTPGPDPAEQGSRLSIEEEWQVAVDYAAARLAVYNQKQASWQALEEKIGNLELEFAMPVEWEECAQQLADLLAGYQQWLDELGRSSASLPAPLVDTAGAAVQRRDIAFLEGDCGRILAADTEGNDWFKRFQATLAAQAEVLVRHSVEKGRYDEAIAAYERLADLSGREAGRAAKQQYGLALLYTDRLEEAVRVYQEILDVAAGTVREEELWKLRLKTANLNFAAGNLAGARMQYQQLLASYKAREQDNAWAEDQLALLMADDLAGEELARYTAVLRAFLASDGKRADGALLHQVERLSQESQGTLAVSAERIRQIVKNRVRAWVGGQLVFVDALVEEREFRQAVTILEELLADDLDYDLKEIVQRTLDDTLLAEARTQESQRLLVEQVLAVRWEAALKLFDSKRYDEAIEAFSALLATEYDERARAKTAEAGNLAVAEKRKEAAALFVKASKATAPELKRDFLISSWRLLKEVVDKYPQAEIIDKVAANLKVLEEQINRFDPALLQSLAAGPEPNGLLDAPEQLSEGDNIE